MQRGDEAASPTTILPALEYARPDADGLPEWLPEAEELIDAGCGPRRLRALFRKSDDAARYFGKSMARRYELDAVAQADATCVLCRREPELVIKLFWQATAPPNTLEFRFSSTERFHSFPTHHAICSSCSLPWMKRAYRLQWLGRIAKALRATAWILLALLLLAGITQTASSTVGWYGLLVWLGLLALSAVVSLTHRVVWYAAVPRPLRTIRRWGVRLFEIADILPRSAVQRASPVLAVESLG